MTGLAEMNQITCELQFVIFDVALNVAMNKLYTTNWCYLKTQGMNHLRFRC